MLNYSVSRCNQTGLQLLLLLVLLLVTWQALSPAPFEQIRDINDKLGHMLVFLFLSALADNAYADSPFSLKKQLYLIGYGISIECLQYFVPQRFFSLLDIVADSIGILLYALIIRYLIHRQQHIE